MKKDRMSWRYCVIRKTKRVKLGKISKTVHYYDIHEVFFDDNGKIEGWTQDPVDANASETINDLRWALSMMLADSFRTNVYEIKNDKLVLRSK